MNKQELHSLLQELHVSKRLALIKAERRSFYDRNINTIKNFMKKGTYEKLPSK
jgi:hypothetical protein